MTLNAEQLDTEIESIKKEVQPLIDEYNAFINEKKPPIDQLLEALNYFQKKRQALD